MKTLITLILCLILTELVAVRDSTKKITFRGAGVEYGFFTNRYGALDQTKLSQQFPGDASLQVNYSGYDKFPFASNINENIESNFAARAYFTLKSKSKVTQEFFIGARTKSSILGALTLQKKAPETKLTYTNPQTGDVITETRQVTNSVSYMMTGRQLFLPFGYQISTNQNKRFWFTVGAELAPGLLFNKRYYSNTNVTVLTEYEKNGVAQTSGTFPLRSYESSSISNYSSPVSGGDFCFYASAPLSMNLRLSKRIKVLKNINLSSSFAFGWLYQANQQTNLQSSGLFNMSLGVRYNIL